MMKFNLEGNVAWAHILALKALADSKEKVDGKVFFVSDDTPMTNMFEFCHQFLRLRE